MTHTAICLAMNFLCNTQNSSCRTCGPMTSFFRFGGAKFLYCAADAELGQDRAIAEQMREGLSRREFFVEGYVPLTVRASFGLTLLDPSVPVEQSIERADQALHDAKAAGRDRIAIWQAANQDRSINNKRTNATSADLVAMRKA